MKPMLFPSKLPRRIAGGFEPVDIFRELVELPCVTFNEYLVYEYLLDEVRYLGGGLVGSQREKLRCGFTEAGQLLVSWRGRSDDQSKSILVAHVDREGLLIRGFDASKSVAYCWHTAGRAPEDLNGSRVRLYTSGQVMSGIVQGISRGSSLDNESPFKHEIVVRIDQQNRASNARFFKNPHFEGFGHYDIPPFTFKDGLISATHVDNTAGVSILVSILTMMVRNSWRANVDFLFTTCEEAGFCGVVAEILNGKHLIPEPGGEVICIVVDSSSHTAFVSDERLEGVDETSDKEEIALQHPVIRTGDKASVFDREVSHLLAAAAKNLQAASNRYERIQWTGKRRLSVSEKLRGADRANATDRKTFEITRPSVAVGRMFGGWCEATPLVLESEIRQACGSLPSLHLRVGAVAIPLANYRNYFKRALNPEKCHESALRGVRDLVGEAVRMRHRWPFELVSRNSNSVQDKKARVERLLAKQKDYAGLLSVTREWIRLNTSEADDGSTGVIGKML
jgi:putative aminopeptidase FrvX